MHVPGSLAGDFKLSCGRLLCLLDEDPEDHHAPPDSRDVDRPGNSVTAGDAKLPQPALEVLDGVAGQSVEADLLDQFGQPDETCRHIRRQAAISPWTLARPV